MDGCAHSLLLYTGKQSNEVDLMEPFTKRLDELREYGQLLGPMKQQ